MATTTINKPTFIKIENTSDKAIGFIPYKENFITYVAAGKTIEFKAENAGTVLYYLAQATDGLVVSQINALDTASETISVLNVPAVITITNSSATRSIRFVPYRENFTTSIAAGDSVELTVSHAGQVLYYLAQATDDLTVTQAAVEAGE